MPGVTTSLTLQSILKSAVSRAGLGAQAPVVAGLTPPAQAFAVAAAAGAAPVLLVVPSDSGVEQMVGDIRFFYGALSGASGAALERSILPLPAPEVDPYRGIAPHLDATSARARALAGLARGTARVAVASVPALLPRVSRPARLLAATRELVVGDIVAPLELGDLLADGGFVPADPVDQHGQFCIRGGVVDCFPAGETYPLRVEFVGDMIESLRRYDPGTQRSMALLDRATVFPLRDTFEDDSGDAGAEPAWDRAASVFDYLLGTATRIIVQEAQACGGRAARQLEQLERSYRTAIESDAAVEEPAALVLTEDELAGRLAPAKRLEALGFDDDDGAPPRISCEPAVSFHGRVADWASAVRAARDAGETQLFIAATPGRAERVGELLEEYDLRALAVDRAEVTNAAWLLVATGQLSRGFRLPAAGLRIHAEADLFAEPRRASRPPATRSFLSNLRDLKVGNHVVHVDHGIGVFVGLKQMALGDAAHELMQIRYAGGDKLFVPVDQLDLVQKYTGSQNPALDRLGGTSWERAKTRVRKAMRDMAQELLQLYAARRAVTGHCFAADTHWQEEFEAAFEYELTPDQATAVADVKRDMEAPAPMDRLLCGDVGYGKTEVALRAAFKAVMDGKQVALLAPTTVLVFQHYKTICDRFAAFPVRIEMVSRFRSRAEQTAILKDLAAGRVDVIVGTHRLLSKDVRFRDLGLLVVDEEQRFGVAHKERIKRLRHKVDVLTMTATPIPRTLNMSLMGIRDMSIIETPPRDRLSIQTNVVRFDGAVLARAIRTELERGGQVYFVHNRIDNIASVAEMVRRIVPEVRLAVAHGRSGEAELERIMIDFVDGAYDVLLSTTIIENGLDIPNVNTIVVNHAERYGLSQLYQLRGRVGRSARRAYAYLLVPPADNLSQVARQRLAAIKEFSSLGSGFRVAALDLEIRGAGNLLGAQQSGHIEAIGFDMYLKLLEETVRELKGEPAADDQRAAVNLGIDLRIDEEYIAETNQRLSLYRRIAAARDEAALGAVLDEVGDRYGPLPASVRQLADYGRIRILADRIGAAAVDRERHLLVIRFGEHARIEPEQLVAFVQSRPAVTLTPPAVIRIDLEALGGAGNGGGGAAGGSVLEPTATVLRELSAGVRSS